MRPEARDIAREAARRSGVSVGEWLNDVIAGRAAEEGLTAPSHHDALAQSDDPALSDLNNRLDKLTRQLENIALGGNRTYRSEGSEHVSQAIARLDQRLDQLISEGRTSATMADMHRDNSIFQPAPATPPAVPQAMSGDSLDQAIAEITARQQALDGQAPVTPSPAAPSPMPLSPMPLSPIPNVPPPAAPGLMPGTAPGTGPGLAPAGTRPDVLPRPATQDLGRLEQQLRQITTQIEALRAPELEESIAALRAELGDISHALQDALPRRSIEALEIEVRKLAERVNQTRDTGVDGNTLAALEQGVLEMRDAVRSLTPAENLGALHLTIEGLAHKIDAVANGTASDPRALQQLEEAIATLRGVVSQVASNDSLNHLAEEMRILAMNVERVLQNSGSAEILSNIDQRIASLSQVLESQRSVDDSARFTDVANRLSEKLEQLAMSRGDHAAVGALEERISRLVEKLDASGARFNHLEAIERALSELLVHLEDQRANGGTMRRADVAPVSDAGAIARDLADIKEAEARTQDSLEVAHGTLGAVVDRLAMIENDMRTEAAPPAPQPAPRPRVENPLPAEPPPPPKAAPPMPMERRPIDPNLPPDHPLEPGLGASPTRAGESPAARIAASEAALGRAKPPVIPDPGTKGDFIAAARRAAQAASMTAAADATPVRVEARPEPRAQEPAAAPKKEKGSIGKRVKSLFVGASVVAIVVGSLQLTSNMVGPLDDALRHAAGRVTTTVAVAPQPQAPATQQAAAEPPPAPGRDVALNGTAGDITGSVRPVAPASTGSVPARAITLDQLPTSFSNTLRSAAVSGDRNAFFEVGSRYVEGRGVPQNFEEAARWLERAANQGLAPAQFRLAGLYEKGIGVKKNLETARKLYLAAAEAGSGKAMHNLAVLHAEGIDGKPDYKIALQWFRRGADHGVPDSQYNLGVLYARGFGVEVNLAESYKWFALAANEGDKDAARKRDDVAAKLDPQSLAAARQAVKDWMPQPQPDAAVTVPAPAGGWEGTPARQSAPVTPPVKRGPSAAGGPYRPAPGTRVSAQ